MEIAWFAVVVVAPSVPLVVRYAYVGMVRMDCYYTLLPYATEEVERC